MLLLHIDRSADNGSRLHRGDLRISHGEAAASVSHHRVELMKGADDIPDLLDRLLLRLSELLDLGLLRRDELVERRIQEADRHGIPLQSLIDGLKVTLLIGQDLRQGLLSLLHGIGADHLPEGLDPLRIKEHVLRPAKTDALRPEFSRLLRVSRRVRIRPHGELPEFIRPAHDAAEFPGDHRVHRRNQSLIDISAGSIDADAVPLMEGLAGERELPVRLVHDDIAAAGDAAGSHASRNDSRVARHTAADSQDALGGLHAGDILRRGLQTDKNDLLSSLRPVHRVIRREHDLSAGGSRRCAESSAQRRRSLQGLLVKLRVQEGVQIPGIDHRDRLLLRPHALVHQIAGNLKRGLRRPLSVSGLQHIELPVLNGKLHILHIPIMLLQSLADRDKLLEGLRELLLHLLDVHRGADTGHDILSLCIGQEFTEKSLLPGRRISGKGHAGAAVISHISKGHGLHIDRRPPGIGDIVVTAVDIGAGIIPGAEDRLDRAVELSLGIIREVGADLLLICGLELLRQLAKIIRRELYILLHASLGLHLVDQLFEILLSDLHHDIGIHLDEAPVAVPGPSRIL